MYVMLDQIRRVEAKTRFGFVHIPHDLALHEAAGVVVGVLKKLGLRGGITTTKPKLAGVSSPT
jgi:pyrrolidone-carboxylate peptidase